MTYRIEIKRIAEKQMWRLPSEILPGIHQRILSLRAEPRPHGVKKLAGGLGWRIRVGDWRVVYEIDDDQRVVTIVAVKSRQSVYE